MSSEESYLAILRYLTDEREPYAPGTEGNVKRKIRKAAACYVVRDGTLYYQRRQKGREKFTELEVVLQAGRRRGLIEAAHITAGGEHLNRHQTWHLISQKYWWRGILKHVKDYIKECSRCQEKQDRTRVWPDSVLLDEFGEDSRTKEDDEGEEEEEEISISELQTSARPKPSRTAKLVSKHELVFVDSKGIVKQCSSKHGQAMLDKLNSQRLNNQFCDITLLIEGEEYRAHKSVLAACSAYFSELFIEKGAISSHEAVVDLSGFSKSSFLPLLEFAYTSNLCFNFCSMAEIATLARHLLMLEVLEICEFVHKQVEEKKLTVYQKGDVHTIVSSGVVPEEHEAAQAFTEEHIEPEPQPPQEQEVEMSGSSEEGPFLVTVQDDDDDTSGGIILNGETVAAGTKHQADIQTVRVAESTTLASVIQNTESPAVTEVIQDDPPEKSQEPDAIVINIETAEGASKAVVHLEARAPPVLEEEEGAEEVQQPVPVPKRKRGRPAKVKQEVIVVEEVETPDVMEVAEDSAGLGDGDATADDTYKSRLRQRSLEEGGYIRLHMGMENKLQNRKGNPRSAVQKVAQRLVKRGRLMQPPKKQQGEQAESTESEHMCSECGMVFQRRYALIMHTLKHEKSRGYKCTLCNKDFQYAASLRAHLARHKRKSETAQPSSRATPDADAEEGAAVGKSKGRTKREFVCDICGRTLPKLYSLRIHMLNHTGVRPHTCKVCGKSFAHKHSLKMHKALHDTLKQFQCTLCDKSFVTKRSLQEHMSIHTGESKYLCAACGKSFHRASGLSKHLKRHQPKPEIRGFPCTQCDKSFYEARDLQQHMNKHLGLKPFQCQVCGKCYSWKKDWYSHVKSHSVSEPYKCNVCGKEFYEKALFRRHVKKATHGKKGRVKQNLERECEHCGRKFMQLREYRRHMNNHQGVKPFECLTCGVAWADARSLKRHVRTHTGERPYVCPVCQDAYIDARTLRKHMTKFHNDYIPGKIMLEKDTLQFHNQGTQVEHAISIIAPDLPPELGEPSEELVSEEIETVLVTEETIEAVEAVAATEECDAVSTLSDQSIMQVVNYVLSHQTGPAKLPEVPPEAIETVEVEVAHVPETE
ncbi:zinc finger and BTB domain-containing protein 11-like [Acipenser oxyrinchus oxyrinchus]|uniref:Zinc finger and BTB domain-containing protein 11-like n=1 Tax=Acipenser oxyrinchus oxyrinchus TaxID=40147 RepID=A0AAD8G925_ACIOX|nr:zinc finger and BTB domain-containing protein 11-like [Acipenser oxyrinchus oxyrinchus]